MKIKLLSPNAKMPTKGSEQAAGYDLYVPKDTIINPGRRTSSRLRPLCTQRHHYKSRSQYYSNRHCDSALSWI
jgi:hypothetical protein